jgi:hypothetical protein
MNLVVDPEDIFDVPKYDRLVKKSRQKIGKIVKVSAKQAKVNKELLLPSRVDGTPVLLEELRSEDVDRYK